MRLEIHVTPKQVSDECGARILKRYPYPKQLNAARRDYEAEMHAWIDAMIARSHELEAMTPIPHDFKADKWWPK